MLGKQITRMAYIVRKTKGSQCESWTSSSGDEMQLVRGDDISTSGLASFAETFLQMVCFPAIFQTVDNTDLIMARERRSTNMNYKNNHHDYVKGTLSMEHMSLLSAPKGVAAKSNKPATDGERWDPCFCLSGPQIPRGGQHSSVRRYRAIC